MDLDRLTILSKPHPSYLGFLLEVGATAAIGLGQWWGWVLMSCAGGFWVIYGHRTKQPGLRLIPFCTFPMNVYFSIRWATA